MTDQTKEADNILAFRPGEEYALHTELPAGWEQFGPYYIVALLDTPDFPGEFHPDCKSKTVICATNQYKPEGYDHPVWGWWVLAPATKQVIGDLLVEVGAPVGQWFYLIVGRNVRAVLEAETENA
jgi:hypothetical protein